MRFRRVTELDVGGTTRCGRCSDILPDETLTFCPACGVPFSQTPPTNSFELLTDHHLKRWMLFERIRRGLIACCALLIVWLSYGILSAVYTHFELKNLHIQPRKLVIYTYDFAAYPSLSKNVKRASIPVAVQAFEDHFGISLDSIETREGQLPRALEHYLKVENPGANERAPFELLSYWETQVFPELTRLWESNPQGELPVLITNIPIVVGNKSQTNIETEHLGESGVVSGLGHPSLVVVSTFRIANREPSYVKDRPPVGDDLDKARYLGEYLLAHEWGHALLGLSDYVTRSSADVGLRSPAALPDETEGESCLMHTDQGGGFEAWDRIRARKLGTPSRCKAYNAILEAYDLRRKGLVLLQQGKGQEGRRIHKAAIAKARTVSQSWVVRTWSQEQSLFTSFFKRWWSAVFMLESKKHDRI